MKLIHTAEPHTDYLDAALVTILQIHQEQPLPGDILVFLTGQVRADRPCNGWVHDSSIHGSIHDPVALYFPCLAASDPWPLPCERGYPTLPSNSR